MKSVIDWIKSNPIILLSIVLAIVSVLWLAWVVIDGGNFVESLVKRGAEKSRLAKYRKTPVTLPPKEPDLPPETKMIAVNQASINDLKTIYEQIGRHHDGIMQMVLKINEKNHYPLDPELYPEPDDRLQHKLYEAKRKYRKALQDMLAAPAADDKPEAVRLSAGAKPKIDELKTMLEETRTKILRRRGIFSKEATSSLDEETRNAISLDLKAEMVKVLQKNASEIQIYATTDIDDSDFSFHVDKWSDLRGPRPNILEIWDSQIGLWIQQDIAAAIMRANQAGASLPTAKADATAGPAPAAPAGPAAPAEKPKPSVLVNPIKHLISIRVGRGFVGINSDGSIRSNQKSTNEQGGGFAGPSGNKVTVLGAAPPAQPLNLGDPDQKLPDEFGLTPSGRRSNPIYDVRHAKVELVADFKRLPMFFNELSRVNLMSVLAVTIEDIDEYQALREGYFYGPQDAVKVTFIVETLWFREWTKKYMPTKVKAHLGITNTQAAPPAASAGTPTGTGG